MHRLTLALFNLVHSAPGDKSKDLHGEVILALEDCDLITIEGLRHALDEITLKSELEIQDSIIAILGMTLYTHASLYKMDKIDSFLLKNQLIQAIKEYRSIFGTSLIEARNRVNERKAYLDRIKEEGRTHKAY